MMAVIHIPLGILFQEAVFQRILFLLQHIVFVPASLFQITP